MRNRNKWPFGFGVLYLMIHIPCVWWVKIGITGKTASSRAKELDKAVLGFPLPIMVMILPGVYGIEQALHRFFRFLSVSFYKGDGHTEWFWIPAAIPVILLGGLYWMGVDALQEGYTGISMFDFIIRFFLK